MRRRLWLFVAMGTLGTALLVAAGFASPASSGTSAATAKKGGTMKLNMSATDVDFTDPSLAYGTISWQIEYATALKLYNYPDAKPPIGSQLQPEAATSLPEGDEQRQDVHDHRQEGLQVLERSHGDRGELRQGDQPRAQQDDAVARRDVHLEHRRRPGRHRRQGFDGQRRQGQGQHAHDQADAAGRRHAGEARHAVLPGDPAEPAAQLARRRRVRLGRPVLHRQPRRRSSDRAQAEHALHGQAPGERGHVPDHGQHEPGPEPAPGEGWRRSTTTWAASRRRPTLLWPRSSASTRAATS